MQFRQHTLANICQDSPRDDVFAVYGNWELRSKRQTVLVFENRVLRKIFGAKRDEVTGEWKRLHNEELNDPYSIQNIIQVIKSRRMRWAGHVACTGDRRGPYRVLVGKPGRPRSRWEDNIEIDLSR